MNGRDDEADRSLDVARNDILTLGMTEQGLDSSTSLHAARNDIIDWSE